ncbi:hypothetical protein OAI93_03655, partial [bacterium]|nr:hypothetical protein [bacterium]
MRFAKSITFILTFLTLSLSNTFDILYDSDTAIAGFQFSVIGVEDGASISASGGAAAANGFTVSAGGTTVLGFSLTGSTIPAGSGILTTIDVGDADVSSACIDGLVVSDPSGSALDFNLDCASFVIGGCEDIDADGICDDVDDCVGEYDECDVCNGDGALEQCWDGSFVCDLADCPDVPNLTVDVLYDSHEAISGFQFSITDGSIVSVSAGENIPVDWSVSSGAGTVLGFSFSGSTIPAGSGTLVTLEVEGVDSACITDLVLSDTNAEPLDYDLDCASFTTIQVIGGCTDSAACNYDESANTDDGSCDYAEENFDCDGNCTAELDCAAVCGGSAVVDECGICSEGTSNHEYNSDQDCNGDCFGSAFIDDCDVCSEGNSDHVANSDIDDCGVCFGGNADQDCAGTCFGSAFLDDCGVCDGDGSSCSDGDVFIDFGYIDTDNGTMEITMDTEVEVGGFQFDVIGIILTGASGGDLSDAAGFTISSGVNTVIGFSFSGNIIPAGSSGVIANLLFTADTDSLSIACFDNVYISDPSGNPISFETGNCVMITEPALGCTDIDACNYDSFAAEDDGSCTYPEENFDCDGNCAVELDCFSVCGGMAMLDCAGDCDGSAVEDDCGVCNGGNTTGCGPFIWLGSYNESTMMMDVLINVGPEPLAGFQFNISGLTGITAFGGLAADAGWTVSAGETTVLGFNLNGGTIPAGSNGVLTTLLATPTAAESCMSGVTMSNSDGAAVDYEVGDCVSLCEDFDMDGICDDVDDCVGEFDECDVCNGDATSCLNVIYFGAVNESTDGNTMEVWISTVDDVAGFQFDVLGAELTGASGGVEDSGWTISFNADGTVLGFDLLGGVIAAGSTALLTTLSFEINEFDACLDFGTGAISDLTGSSLPSGTGDCYTYMTAIGGCTDMAACNYDETANVDQGCEYAEENFDCNGDCTVAVDCAGVCGGSSELDECGVCDGSGPEENFDCDGNCVVE